MDFENFRLKQLHGQLGEVAYQLTRIQFSQCLHPKAWSPSINAYRCKECMVICVDLAGVNKSQIDLQVEPNQLLLKGRREAPEPEKSKHEALQILAMEIDYGPFERSIPLPSEVDTHGASAEQRNGFLWIYLPLRAQT